VAGNSNPTGRSEGFRFDTDSSIHDLGNLDGSFPSSFAWGINDLGQVTGGSNVPSIAFCFFTFGSHAFRTAGNSALTVADDLGTLISNCRSSLGTAINSSGQVVGWSDFGSVFSPEQHAMLVTGSVMQDLGILGGTVTIPPISGKNAIANAINSSGQIVGESTYNGAPNFFDQHAFLTTASGPMLDLGTLGGTDSFAFGINSSGQIVGQAGVSPVLAHGFLYTGGTMIDLNSLIAPGSPLEIITAFAINDSGQIVGTGKMGTGLSATFHPVRLDPSDVAVTILKNLLSDPSLGLTMGQINSLTDKLNNALASIQAGLNKQAINQLNAFVNSVQVFLKNGNISASAAATLIAAANAIIAVL
jgi:probable HAF family extracellular repeat protein